MGNLNLDNKFNIIVKTYFGLEDVLAAELKSLRFNNIQKLNRAVQFEGNLSSLYEANLKLRTGLSVLIPVFSFTAKNEQRLYKKIYEIDWSEYFTVSETFAIDSSVHSKYFTHSKYAALKMKDAIADQFRKKFKNRPSVDTDNPDIRLDLHISQDKCTVSINSSGDSLFKRGYRIDRNEAPLNEILAAGMISLSGWDKKKPFLDPMCGSGTITIEAAMMANNISPGSVNRKFGFEKWKNFDSKLWKKISDVDKSTEVNNDVNIYAYDIDPKNIIIAKNNLKRTGLEGRIKFGVKDFFKSSKPEDECMIITNPPYGLRLKEEDIVLFYKNIGDTLKNSYTGCDAWVLSGNKDALKFLGLRPSEKYTLFNGPIESKFYKYSMYTGSKKKKYN